MSGVEDNNKAFDTSQIDTAAICLKGIDRAVRIDLAKRVLIPELEKEDEPP
jgi:hypothetical protein